MPAIAVGIEQRIGQAISTEPFPELAEQGWLGRKPQFFSDTMAAAMESVLIGKASVKDAFAQAKTKIDAELAKK